MALAFELLGLIGSFLLSSSIFAQIFKVFRTKSAADISFTWQLLHLFGILSILTYGFGENLWPISVPVTFEARGALILFPKVQTKATLSPPENRFSFAAFP